MGVIAASVPPASITSTSPYWMERMASPMEWVPVAHAVTTLMHLPFMPYWMATFPAAMLREVTEIESIGDSCYNLARTINRKRQTNQDFTEKQYEHIHFMMKLTNDALAQMIVVVEKPEHQSIDINKSFNIENEINNYRNQLKNQNILDVNNKEYDYQMGVYYMDIIAECEKLGDYVVNVVEASSDVKEKRAS